MLTPQEIEHAHHKAVEHAKAEHQGCLLPDDLIEAGAQALSDKLSKLTPEGLREEIGKKICGIYQKGEACSVCVAKRPCTVVAEDADSILSLLNSQIEQAVTKERERIATWGNEACPHVHNVLSIRPKHACAICWEELLKDGK